MEETRCPSHHRHPGDLPRGRGLPDSLFLPTLEAWLLVSRASAGWEVLVYGGGAEAGFATATIQLLFQLQSQTIVHLNTLLQLPSQSSDLCHHIAQVTTQRTGIPGVS